MDPLSAAPERPLPRATASAPSVLPGSIVAALSGAALALAFPSIDWSPLAWISLVPLLWVGLGGSLGRAFRMGWLGGFTFFLGTLYWIVFTISHYTALSPLIAVGPLILLCAFLGCAPAIFVCGCAYASRYRIPLVLAAPPLWVTLEWVRGWILGGFPWVGLGYSQWRSRYLIQFAEFTGVHGIAALIVLVNVVVYQALRRSRDGTAPRVGHLAMVATLLALCIGWGYARVQALHALPTAGEVQVAAIQGNIAQDVKWDPAYQESTIEHYASLTEQAAAAGAEIVVWPEAAAPIFFQSEGELQERIRALAHRLDVWLVFGSAAYGYADGEPVLHNRAYVVAPNGDEQSYDKIKLVPFGEFVPLADVFYFVHKIVEGVGDFRPGREAVVATTPQGRFGILICYEGIFPELTRRFAAGGADFLVNITNDAWFGNTSAPYQHLAMGTLRAVENRAPFVRVANTGFSAMVDIDGTIRWRTDLFETAWRVDTVRWVDAPTVYAQYGDVFVAVCVVLVVALGLVGPVVFRMRRQVP